MPDHLHFVCRLPESSCKLTNAGARGIVVEGGAGSPEPVQELYDDAELEIRIRGETMAEVQLRSSARHASALRKDRALYAGKPGAKGARQRLARMAVFQDREQLAMKALTALPQPAVCQANALLRVCGDWRWRVQANFPERRGGRSLQRTSTNLN